MTEQEQLETKSIEKEHLEKLYKRTLSDSFFSKSIPITNKLVGINPNSEFSLGLFLKLPINFTCFAVDDETFYSDDEINFDKVYLHQKEIVKFIISNIKAYVISTSFSEKIEVNMQFNYRTETDLVNINKAINTDIGILFLSFIYFHEIQHILRRHNTSTFNDIMLRTAKAVDSEKYKDYYKDVHQLANIAEDYSINNSLLTLFENTKNFHDEIKIISQHGLFDKNYINDNEVDILEKILLKEPDIRNISEDEVSVTIGIQEKNDDGSNKGEEKIITIPKQLQPNSSGDSKEDKEKQIGKQIKGDQELDALADSIQNQIDEEKEKGNGSFVFNQDIGKSIKTNVDWFDKLKSSFFTIVNRKTKQTLVNWSKLNSKYSHSHKSPTHRNITNTLNLILSVDNSGSMSDDALKKLLFIIEQKKSKIGEITILKHTDTITNVLKNEKNENEILGFLGTRDMGGTSHKEVFKYLDHNISKHDIHNSIYISFSDNYSDIEMEYFNYKNIQKITKVWLNADGKPVMDNVSGLKVDIF